MADPFVDPAHIKAEIVLTCDNIVDLLRKFPRDGNFFQAVTAHIPGSRPPPPSNAIRLLNILLNWWKPDPTDLFVRYCEHVDPYTVFQTPLVDPTTGHIDVSRFDKFPLPELRPEHTRILLPFSFKTVSWFLVEVVLDVMPQHEDTERQAAVKVYTNIQGCVHLRNQHQQSIGDWVIDLLEYASRPPRSPLKAVDWRNGRPIVELFIEELDHRMDHLGVIVATGFIADKGSAIALLLADTDLQYQACLACAQLIEQRILRYNFQPYNFRFNPSDRLLSPSLPYFSDSIPDSDTSASAIQP